MAHKLFFDVTELANFDKGTGIQRVTRALFLALNRQSPSEWQVIPVCGDSKIGRFLTVPSMMLKADLAEERVEIKPCANDIFLSVDLTYNITPSLRQELVRFREKGVGIYFVVYDLIPLRYPQWFEGTNEWFEGNDYLELFANWFESITEEADGLLCISESVQNDVEDWLAQNKPHRPISVDIGYFHLGSDINQSLPTKGFPLNAEEILRQLKALTSFLMVGTLEPRKGHELALDAIEGLWEQGKNVNLVIVGRAGWKIDHLVDRIKKHPRFETNLFWLEGISDEYLHQVYLSSSALLSLSLAEGFGLPLVEAGYFALPIIARDIPVFREVCGAGATYFAGTSSVDLLELLKVWLLDWEHGDIKTTTQMKIQSWEESSQQLMSVIGKMRGDESFWRASK